MTRVSVLMPCFNAASYVSAAIQSVLAQTWTDLELIVVDDGSTDDSAEIAATFAPRGVRLLRQRNASAAAARNAALAASGGSHVLFLDADDLIAPTHLSSLLAALEHAPEEAVAVSAWSPFRKTPGEQRKYEPLPSGSIDPVSWLVGDWRNAQPMTQSGMFLLPRSLLERVGGWDERLSLIDDFEFFARVLTICDGLRAAPDACLYYRRAVPDSLSGQKSRAALESALLSLELGTGHLLRAEDSARTRLASANLFRNFDYEHYPDHPDLRARARARAEALGGGDLEPIGSPNFHRARRLVGWRAARLLEKAARRLGATGMARSKLASP